MVVRRAQPGDAAAFAEVVAEVAEEGRWVLMEAPVDVTAFADRISATIRSGQDALWVLEDGDRVVGALGLHLTSAPGVRSLGMSMLPAARGRGAGRALLDAALDFARSEGVHKVELEVFPWNVRAISLYAAAGFEVEGVRRDHYLRRDGSRWTVLLMALPIDAA